MMIFCFYTASKLKQKSELLNDEFRSKEEEKRRQKEAVARLKAQQRSEVRKGCDQIKFKFKIKIDHVCSD